MRLKERLSLAGHGVCHSAFGLALAYLGVCFTILGVEYALLGCVGDDVEGP